MQRLDCIPLSFGMVKEATFGDRALGLKKVGSRAQKQPDFTAPASSLWELYL